MRTKIEIDNETARKLLGLAKAQHVSVEQLPITHVAGLGLPLADG
jgi:hypothetical protein